MIKMKDGIRAAAIEAIRAIKPDTVQRRFIFPSEFPGFAGHFPGFPILPAIVQVQTAFCLAEDWLGAPLRLLGVENAKFLLQLRPGEEINVECRERRRDGQLVCDGRLWRAEELAASFQLILATEPVSC